MKAKFRWHYISVWSIDFRPVLRKEHVRLYQFELSNKWEGAYRSMGALRDE